MAPPTPPAPSYGLPALPTIPCPDFKGPTPWSNWVIKSRLLAGAYPASLDDAETDRILTTLLELGVNTFVCLQAEFSLHTPEGAWRAGQGLRPYIKDAQQILIRARESGSHRIKQDKLDFLHLPIIDGSVTTDVALSRLADDCCVRLLRGERLYIHCWGGHGRTGTLVAVMLGRLYGLTCASALRFTQAFHDSRRFPQGVRSPQTTPQVAQVKRLLLDPPSLRGVSYTRDPSIVLDDTILRPSSTPPSPVRAKPMGSSSGVASASRSKAAGEMEVEAAQQLPSVPMNQQRKDAIRAKQTGNSSSGAARATTGVAHAEVDITAVLRATSLHANEAEAGDAPMPGGSQRLDWLQSVFDKGQSKLAAMRRASNGSSNSQAANACSESSLPEYGNSYLQQYVQQQQQMEAGGKPGAISGKPVINLHASASSTPALGSSMMYGEDVIEALDMRPSKVTVAVPGTESGPERSASSMARMLNYFSGRSMPAQ